MKDHKVTKRLIDLSHPLEPATPPWPGNPPVEVHHRLDDPARARPRRPRRSG